MRFDIENQLCEAQAFTGAVTVSQHSYEKQTAKQDLSIGRRLALLVLPVVAAADAAATVKIDAIQADDAALTTNVEQLSSVSVASAKLALGEQVEVPIPQGSMSRQYLGARVTITGGVTNTATLDIYLMPQDEIAVYKSFPKVVNAEV